MERMLIADADRHYYCEVCITENNTMDTIRKKLDIWNKLYFLTHLAGEWIGKGGKDLWLKISNII